MKNKGKILVADDNQGIRTALKLLRMPQFAEMEVIASPKTLVTTTEQQFVYALFMQKRVLDSTRFRV